MLRQMLKCKIHRATVTESELNYEGSITIDRELIEAAGMLPYEQVMISNLNNGERFVTYVLPGDKGSGTEREIIDALKKDVSVGILGYTGQISDLIGSLDIEYFSYLAEKSGRTISAVHQLTFVEDNPSILVSEAFKIINRGNNYI